MTAKPKPTEAPRKARIYLRVSSQRQAEHGLTISREGEDPGIQEELCRKLIVERGWECVGVYSDPGITGRRNGIIRRVGLAKCIEDTCRDKGVIVFYDITRLGRSAGFLITLRERLEDAKASLISYTNREMFDTTSAYGVFFYNQLALIAQLYSDMMSENAKVIHARWKRMYGKSPTGEPRFGFKRVNNREVACPEEQSIIRAVRAEWTLFEHRNKRFRWVYLCRWLNGEEFFIGSKRFKRDEPLPTIRSLRNAARGEPTDIPWNPPMVKMFIKPKKGKGVAA